MLAVAAQHEQRRRETHGKRRFGQLQAGRAAGQQTAERAPKGRVDERSARQLLALHHQHGKAAQGQEAQHIVVVMRAVEAKRQPAGHAEERDRRRPQPGFRVTQAVARHEVERHDVGGLEKAQHRDREPGCGVDRQPIEGNVDERVVIAGLMGNRDVDVHAPVEKRIRDIPVVIAEVPGRVLAQPDDIPRPDEDGEAEKGKLARRQARNLHRGIG